MGATPRGSRLATITIGVAWLVLAAGSVGGQQSRPSSLVPRNPGGGTSVISPVVVARWFTNRKAEVEELELLVLWRGTPGWFLQPGGSGSSGSGTGSHYTWMKYRCCQPEPRFRRDNAPGHDPGPGRCAVRQQRAVCRRCGHVERSSCVCHDGCVPGHAWVVRTDRADSAKLGENHVLSSL